jgi:hypothetical protein
MIGKILRNVRAGTAKLLMNCKEVAQTPQTITVTSAAFAQESAIPLRFTAAGENLSPPLAWSGAPEGTQSVVLVIEDPDAPLPFPVVHAIAYNLPSNGSIPESAIPNGKTVPFDGFQMGKNIVGASLYRGPNPVPDHGVHHYYFQFFALDRKLEFSAPPARKQILAAMSGHTLAKGLLVGTCEKRSHP